MKGSDGKKNDGTPYKFFSEYSMSKVLGNSRHLSREKWYKDKRSIHVNITIEESGIEFWENPSTSTNSRMQNKLTQTKMCKNSVENEIQGKFK